MDKLDVTYFISNKETSVSLDDNTKSKWTFLDNLELKVNDKIEIYEETNQFLCELNLYKKRANLHIFSCVCSETDRYFSLDYNFFLVWVNNANIYTFIQNNKKSNKIKENNNNIYMTDENIKIIFNGLFNNHPVYYEDSASRAKSIKKLEELPQEAYMVVSTGNNGVFCSYPDGKEEPVESLIYVPI